MTAAEVAEALHVSRGTVYNWRQVHRRPKPYRSGMPGSPVRYRAEDVAEVKQIMDEGGQVPFYEPDLDADSVPVRRRRKRSEG